MNDSKHTRITNTKINRLVRINPAYLIGLNNTI